MLFQPLENFIQSSINNFALIPQYRKDVLLNVSNFIHKKALQGKKANLLYVCTHNSRRSHFGQIWAKIASTYYGIENIEAFSAGTEATAFNPNAIKAIEKAGCLVKKTNELSNPFYEVSFCSDSTPIICFSKDLKHSSIPNTDLLVVMTCTDADHNCPFVPGAEARISCTYEDPKSFDGTELQDSKYLERCRQIATECLYTISIAAAAIPGKLFK